MKRYPFIKALEEKVKKEESRFFVPGHKGMIGEMEIFSSAALYDFTELDDTDSLYEASGIIKDLEDRVSHFYGSGASAISAGGATLCIQTMLAIAAERGGTILMGRGAHASAMNAAGLLGLEPEWIYAQNKISSGVFGNLEYSDVAEAIDKHEKISALYITSPDYLGVCVDILSIAGLCKERGILLLVDNAHGSHLSMVSNLHPIRAGADFCVDSFHKTLPCLTGAAALHMKERAGYQDAKAKMALFGSSSPSYLIMASIDYAFGYLEELGVKDYISLAQNIYFLKTHIEELGFNIVKGRVDPLRISFSAKMKGYSGMDLKEYLISKGIVPETIIGDYAVLVPTPFNQRKDFDRLKLALENMPKKRAVMKVFSDIDYFKKPLKKMEIREAILTKSETISISEARGRISAENKFTCPPGIPVLIAGEEIDDNLMKILLAAGISSIKVVK